MFPVSITVYFYGIFDVNCWLLIHVQLCDPVDCSPPGSSAHGILQARIMECVAIPFSRGCSRPRDWTWVSWIAGGFFHCLSHQGNPPNYVLNDIVCTRQSSPTKVCLPLKFLWWALLASDCILKTRFFFFFYFSFELLEKIKMKYLKQSKGYQG